MISEIEIELLEREHERTRKCQKDLLEYMDKEYKRRRKALIKSWVIILIVATIFETINMILRINPIVCLILGMLVGSITMKICIYKFDL